MSPHRPGRSPLAAFGLPPLVGALWLLLEVACIALRAPVFDLDGTLRRLLHVLPFQLGLFALLGALLAVATRRSALRPKGLVWVSLWLATLVFLGAHVGLGAYRTGSVGKGVLAIGLCGLLGGLLLAALAAAGRLLPQRARAAWSPAVWAGWSVFWVAFLRRAGPALALGDAGEVGWAAVLFDPTELAFATGVAALVLGLGGLRRPSIAGVAAGLLAIVLLPATARAAARPDVLVILVDTLRADDLREAGGTPNLDALAAESVDFTRAYSPSNNTPRTLPAIFTSLSHRVTGQGLPHAARTLPEVLHDGGWATQGISANPWISAQYGYDQGFDALYDAANAPDFLVATLLQIFGALTPSFAYHTGLVTADLYYQPAAELSRRATGILEHHPAPLFLYVHTMDVHGPYLPPRRFLDADYRPADFWTYFEFNHAGREGHLDADQKRPQLRNLRQRYRGEIRYTDAELGRLFQAYRDEGRWDETLVWFLADHGEGFGEHGFTGHANTLNENLIHVPFLLKPPRSSGIEPRKVDVPVSTGDLLPTTAALLGLAPPEPVFGRDLSPLLRGEAVPPRTIISSGQRSYAAVRWPFKLHLPVDDRRGEVRRLHDLERDPDENRDVSSEHPDLVRSLEAELLQRMRREQEIALKQDGTAVDEHLRRQLESLGYVE